MIEFLKQNSELITIILSIIISIATAIYVVANFLMLREMSRQRKQMMKATYGNQILVLKSIKINLEIENIEKKNNILEAEIMRLNTSIEELEVAHNKI